MKAFSDKAGVTANVLFNVDWQRILAHRSWILLLHHFSRKRFYFESASRFERLTYFCLEIVSGYSTQPNLKKSVVFLYPLVPCALLFVLAFLFNWNWTQSLVTFYRTRL